MLELRVPLNDRDGEPLDLGILGGTVGWIAPELSFDEALSIASAKRHELVLCLPEFALAARKRPRPGS